MDDTDLIVINLRGQLWQVSGLFTKPFIIRSKDMDEEKASVVLLALMIYKMIKSI